MDLDEPGLLLRPQLRAAGYTDDELRGLRRSGVLTLLRRGAYLAGSEPDDSAARHALLVRATREQLGADAVVSHISAAVLHGLPVWSVRLDRVHVTRARGCGGRRGTRTHVHPAPLDSGEIVVIDGLAVTTLARTVVDVARGVPFEQAVVVADAALARPELHPAELATATARAMGWPGAPRARRVVAFADSRSESVGESRSRVAIARAGLPVPVPQWMVYDQDGLLVGRTDFGWPEFRTVGEFDGRVKYGRLLRPGQDPGQAVYEEKLREDALRSRDLTVERWTWPDLRNFAPIAARLRRRLA